MAHYEKENVKKKLVIEAQIKSIMHTILENCKKESECKSLQIPLEDYEDRVANYTGLQKKSLFKLLDIEPLKIIQQSNDLVQHIVILKALLKFYKNRQLPKYNDLFQIVKDVFLADDIVQFRLALTSMGFDYRKTINGIMIAEDPELSFERFHYLKKLKKLRSAKVHICYLEERYINSTLSFDKPDFDKDPDYEDNDTKHLWKGFYLYHVLSDTGLENYFITNKICKLEHNKWVFDNLLNVLKPECAIVIDNHPLHGELVDDTITRYHSKADMVNWLRKNNIPCSADSMCKPELYELISRCNKPTASYDFDRLLKAHGHEVLRLPNGYNGLSPTPLLWMEVPKEMPDWNAECTSLELEQAIINAIIRTHKAFWKLIKQKVLFSEGVLETLYFETEAALENCEPFDVKNVNSHTKVPDYFYVLDNY